jgi:hypothetical protein
MIGKTLMIGRSIIGDRHPITDHPIPDHPIPDHPITDHPIADTL